MCIDTRNIYWLAGILEGEGCFKFNRKSPNISLVMTDEDIVRQVAGILGTDTVTRWPLSGCRKKYPWYTGVSGNKAAAWMMTLYPFMGSRRQGRIKLLLKSWLSYKPRYVENTICGHVNQPYCARGMCSRCYHREKYLRKRGNL